MWEEKYKEEEANEFFETVMRDVNSAANAFTKTIGFKQLSYKEQKTAVEVIVFLGEFMFDYHLESMDSWSPRAIEDVMISVFPVKVAANVSYFEKIENILVKFLEYLDYTKQHKEVLVLIESVKKANVLMLNEVHVELKKNNEDQLFDLGEEMGIDTSDLNELDKLFKLVSYFETPKKKLQKMKIISIEDLKREKFMRSIHC